jgi:hypothetical protein
VPTLLRFFADALDSGNKAEHAAGMLPIPALCVIKSRIEFIMNVQGLMTPVTINNRVDIYDYDMKLEIETPFI